METTLFDNSRQRTALRAAADAERWADSSLVLAEETLP